jgi:hypothetical protein
MSYNYKLSIYDEIIRLEDGATIPSDIGNCDYQKYLQWLNEGNAPIPKPQLPLPPPDYFAFWNALLVSDVYASIRTQSMSSLPINTLATEFISLIGDAKIGRPNEPALQYSMSAIFTNGAFTETNIEEFNNLLKMGNLDGIYQLS